MLMTRLSDIRQLTDEEYQRAFLCMSDQRQTQCRAYHRQNDKKLCVAGDRLLKQLLHEQSGIPTEDIHIFKTPNGKPYTDIPGLYISLSHADDYAFAAVSDAPIGVDIERIRPVAVGTTRHFCTPGELKALGLDNNKNTPPASDFAGEALKLYFELWTFKEAYFKCYGFPQDFTQVDYFEHPKQISAFDDYICCVISAKP